LKNSVTIITQIKR